MSILIATNGSLPGGIALRLGCQIALRASQSLTILTVLRHGADLPLAASDAIVTQVYELVGPYCADVQTRVRIGHPAAEIVQEAEDGGYDLVIVGGSQDRNLVARFLHGSTAVRVVEHASCPVIVAKGTIRPIRRILLCDSGSRDPSVGLAATKWPTTLGTEPTVVSRFAEMPINLFEDDAKIVVLHVMSQMSAGPGVEGKGLRGGVDDLFEAHAPEGELLERDIKSLEMLGLCARAKVRHGLVVEEILEEVAVEDYDLVVIGAYRGHGWQRILLDDLAHRLVIELDRPVLVVR